MIKGLVVLLSSEIASLILDIKDYFNLVIVNRITKTAIKPIK